MISIIGFIALVLIGACLCIAGLGLVAVDRIFGGGSSWLAWAWVIAGAWIITVALSSVPFDFMTGGAA